MNSEKAVAWIPWVPNPCGNLVLIALAAILAVSACSGGPDDRILAVTDDPSILSPLNQLIGISTADAGGNDERVAQESIADCMARAGFEYLPVSVPGDEGLSGSAGIPTREEVERTGYGFAASVEREFDNQAPLVDPNEEIRAGLSGAEGLAYDAAMTGLDADEVTWSPNGQPLDPATGLGMSGEAFELASQDGCLYQAYSSGLNPDAAALLGSDAYFELQQRLASDPRMVALVNAWSECMSAEGYSYRAPEQAPADIAGQAETLLSDIESQSPPPTDNELDRLVDDLRSREVQVALADWDCSADLFADVPGINRELEVQFILDNETVIVDIIEAQAER